MSDLKIVAELDDKKFRDGLSRLRAQVNEYRNANVRAEVNAQREVFETQKNYYAKMSREQIMAANYRAGRLNAVREQLAAKRAQEEDGGMGARAMAVIGKTVAAVGASFRIATRLLDEYQQKTGAAVRGQSELAQAVERMRMGIARDMASGGTLSWIGGIVNGLEQARQAAATLYALPMRMLFGPSGEGRGLAGIRAADEAAQLDEQAAIENRRALAFQVARMEQRARTAGKDEAGMFGIRLNAMRNLQAINARDDLSPDQRNALAVEEARIRDRQIAEARQRSRDEKSGNLAEMRAVRAQRLRDEEAAAEARGVESDRKNEQARREREAKDAEIAADRQRYDFKLKELQIDEARARGQDDRVKRLQIELDVARELADLNESSLSSGEKARIGRRIRDVAALRNLSLFALDRVDPRTKARGGDIEGSIDPGDASVGVITQVFGGRAGDRKADELVSETKTQTVVLRQILAEIGTDVATFGP